MGGHSSTEARRVQQEEGFSSKHWSEESRQVRSNDVRQAIVDNTHSPEFVNQPPMEMFAKLVAGCRRWAARSRWGSAN